MKSILFPLLLIVLMIDHSPSISDPVTDFLTGLTDEQRASVVLPMDDNSREQWHFFPATMWPRPGLQVGDLNAEQRDLLWAFLQEVLSAAGYKKAQDVIELERVLTAMGGDPDFRDPLKYHIVFYGDPARDPVWAWSFEGHHLSLNATIVDGKVSIAPRFFGANPAVIPTGERTGHRVLADEEDVAFTLIKSMSPDQRDRAIFSTSAPPDILTFNESRVDPLDPEGIAYRDLSNSQQAILRQLLQTYLSVMPEALAQERLEKLRSESFDEIRFAWAGATDRKKPHYYRVQGKSFLIEYDNTLDNVNHVHSVWRDFNGDFGRDLIKEHYEKHH